MEMFRWIIKKTKEFGLKKVSLGAIGIIAIVCIVAYLWGIEKDVIIEPYVNTDNVLQQDKEMEVTRTGKVSEGISITSIASELFSGVSSETEAISTFNELMGASEQLKTKKETMIVPEGAGYCDFGGMTLYTWKKSGKHFLTGEEFTEIHVVFLYEGQYISVSIGAHKANISFGADIETGTY